MEQIKVRIEIDPAVAVRHGGARAGRGLFAITEEQLAELSDAQREIVAKCASLDTGTSWGIYEQRLTLQGVASWETVKAAILLREDQEAAKKIKTFEAFEAAVQQLLHGPLIPAQLADALATVCNNLSARVDSAIAAQVLLGRIAAKSSDPRVTAWLEDVRARADAARAAEVEGVAAKVRENPTAYRHQHNDTAVFWGPWGTVTAGEVRAALGAWWTDYEAQETARSARNAAEVKAQAQAAAARQAEREARLMAWSTARSPSIAAAIAEGYSQRDSASQLLADTITDGLTLPDAAPAVWVGDDDLTPRNNVNDAALAALKATRERAQTLQPQLPEGVTLTVGRISRETFMHHAADCDPNGACSPDCAQRKRTVVAVQVTGRDAETMVVAVPVE